MTGVNPIRCSLVLLSLAISPTAWAQIAEPHLPTDTATATSLDKSVRDGQVVEAAEALLKRLLPTQMDHFSFEVIPPIEQQDVFQLETRGDQVIIRGNNGVSLATGLNWYLKHYCHCHVSWYGNQLQLPDPLPVVEPMFQRTSWAKHRYFLNYCCFGYSLPFWDWDQWEQLIDWMALNGVNMPLAVTGEESVWRAVCRRMGMTDDEIVSYLAGPPFLPFQWMGCLDGWGAPLPARWVDRHAQLQRKILARQRQLGMTPVLQGFTGHVPATIRKHYPDVKLHSIRWIEWETYLLDPLDPRFAEISKLWMEEQSRLFGTDHFYAADTFIEMTPPVGELDYLAKLGAAIYQGMAQHDPDATWVLQGWAFMFRREFWTQPRIEAFLDATPDERMVVLDLMCESRPMWNETEAFCGKPWLWCNIQDWGRRIFLGGDLSKIVVDLPAARRDASSGKLSGLGFVNEGLGYNPVVYDLMYEMAWRNDLTDLQRWITSYAQHRYGKVNPDAEAAWQTLTETIYQAPQGNRSVIDHMPSLTPSGGAPYDNLPLTEVWHQLLKASHDLEHVDTYRFDLVNVARQCLANHASILHRDVIKAYQAKNAAAFDLARQQFLTLMLDLDRLLATRPEFLLGRWLEDAKRWGDTPEEQHRMEWNARRVLTLWGDGPEIDDYACKQWAGLISGYYHERWKRHLDQLSLALHNSQPFDEQVENQNLRKWMAAWSDQHERYATEPQGDSIAIAQELWDKYHDSFVPDALSLTTGKPVTCSHALAPFPPRLANDGWAGNTDRYWATDVQQHPGPAWWQVDLQETTPVGRIVVVTFFGDQRHYGFTVETSLDGQIWDMVADHRDNAKPSTVLGEDCRFESRPVRYIRVTQTRNSANSGRHLVEVMAYAK